MKEKVLYIVIAVAAVSFAAGWFAHRPAQNENQLAAPVSVLRDGIYDLVGKNPGSAERTYKGTVEIKRTGNIYDLVWKIANQTQRGVGILNNGILSVGYIDMAGGDIKDAGAVSYTAVTGELLNGQWTSVIGGTAGEETLTWEGSIPSEPQEQI
ncbi:MAG: hypothetical protein Q7K44_03855 [Candidatus Liptonbacteria bacterium]|nr:hypothetical protein [Candidatus Liptonbacteria bacterium]